MTGTEPKSPVRVWDLPTRLFHWLLVALFVCSWLTARYEMTAWHLRSGAALLALVLFRLGWGLVGSTTARFRSFLATPLNALRYLSSLRPGQPPQHHAGHNPAGGWMILVMLSMLCLQLATGLCANDDLQTYAPLAELIGKDWSDRLTLWHGRLFQCLTLLVWLHVMAAGYYALVRGEGLISAMITGRKPRAEVPEGIKLRFAPWWLAALLLLAAVAAVGWLFRAD